MLQHPSRIYGRGIIVIPKELASPGKPGMRQISASLGEPQCILKAPGNRRHLSRLVVGRLSQR